MQKIISSFYTKTKDSINSEIVSGISVALLFIPESLIISLISGIPPLVVLYASVFFALVTAILGGRPGSISGVSIVAAVLVGKITKAHGVEYVASTFFFAGLLQILGGFLKLDKIIHFISKPIIFGFLLNLVIVIFITQLTYFKDNLGAWFFDNNAYTLLALVILSIAIILALKRLKLRLPVYLIAILTIFMVVYFLGIKTKTIGDLASLSGNIPFKIQSISFNLETLKIIFPYSIFFAIMASIESLLKLKIVDNLTESNGNSKKEIIAQGSANIISGLFFGIGGFALINLILINISSGARARLSGVVTAVILFALIYFAGSYIEKLPLAPFIGILFVVSIGTFQWIVDTSFLKFTKSGMAVMILVALFSLAIHYAASV